MRLRVSGRKPGWPLRDHLATWRRARRYAVPAWMVDHATRHRLAGDWAGACAAARIAVDDGLLSAAASSDELRADLAALAPDLLRYHQPRATGGRAELLGFGEVILAEYGDSTVLSVHTPNAG